MEINRLQPAFLYLFLLNTVLLTSSFQIAVRSKIEKSSFNDSVLIAKNFPFLFIIEKDRRIKSLIERDKAFQQIKSVQHKTIDKAGGSCRSVSCLADSLNWSSGEIAAAGTEFIKLYERKRKFRKIIPLLKKQGCYALYESLPDTSFLRNAWDNAAKGINNILNVYIKGENPRYANIDSISFKKEDVEFETLIWNSVEILIQKNHNNIFFEFPLQSALSALRINGRNEAGRFEPLSEGQNSEPFIKAKTIDFSSYTYSVILIPGLGPEHTGVALDPGGAKRCEEGVARFRNGLAPFIIVSGGNVHPYKTPYNEAAEMKKYMVEKLGVPANVIFIEPHARHTTTNLRNTSRMIYHFDLPADKPILIVTDSSQSSYIVQKMDKTAMRDLGYIPYGNLRKISETETEFYPVWVCLQVDPFDPIDP